MSGLADNSATRRPFSASLLRWSVPAVYAVCIVFISANVWEDHQRVRLAENVAQVINEGNPETVEELEGLIADHVDEPLRDYSDSDDPSHSYRGFQLAPRVWLTLWAEYETETGNLVDTWMIYAASERVSLDAPLDGLPQAPSPVWIAVILLGVVCSLLWYRVSRTMALESWARGTFAVLAALPLLLFVPSAVICYLRVTI